MVDDNIWHRWFSDGIVESETILSRSTLAHIYDKIKAKTTSPSIGSAKRGPLVLHRARNARIRFKPQIDFLLLLKLRGRRARYPRSAGVSCPPSTTKFPDAAAAKIAAEATEAAAILALFRKKAGETHERHALNPEAGEGNSRLIVVIDTSHPDLTITEVPRMALTVLSVFLRGLNIFGVTLIGRGHFSEVYSCRDSNGHPTGLVVKVAKTASSLDSIKEGQAGTEAYALFLGEMLALSGAQSPFVRVNRRLILVAAPAKCGQYVSVLFMEEGVRTGTADVLKLSTEIHMPNGSFSPAGLKEAGKFVRAALKSVGILHSLDIAHRDLKPANILIDKNADVVLSDAGMAVFPTSLHRPVPSPGASPPTPTMPPQIASSRARHLLQVSGGKTVQRSPPGNPGKHVAIQIHPTELEAIFSREFRVRDNAGTHAFCGPEFPFTRIRGTMTSKDFLPGDMWAIG
jgi:hypothetical protein